ncbi:MAG: hypothetical protein K0S55_411 [Clostridia bacterium]|jgi:hypothetical protein|nr:hypothetical protein [Clostridia bacterium]
MSRLCSSRTEATAGKGQKQANKKENRTWYSLVLGYSLTALIFGSGFIEGNCFFIGVPICFIGIGGLIYVAVGTNNVRY